MEVFYALYINFHSFIIVLLTPFEDNCSVHSHSRTQKIRYDQSLLFCMRGILLLPVEHLSQWGME